MPTSANDSHLDIAEPVSAIAADPVAAMTNDASNVTAPVTEPATDKPRDSGADRSIGAPVEEPAAVDAPTNAGQALARAQIGRAHV